MADKYLKDEDEEYQFPSSEYIGHKESTPEEEETEGHFEPIPPKEPFSFKDNLYKIKEKVIEHKRFVAICGIILVILLAFNLMRPRHTTQVISQAPAPAPAATQPSTAQPTSTQAPISPIDAATREELLRAVRPTISPEQVTRLQAGTAANQSQLQRLQDQMKTMQDDLRKTTEAQRVLNDNISGLNAELKELVNQLNTTGKPRKKPKIILTEIMPAYHLRAVIPGRAWLEDDQGQTLTVAIGDKLLGYGRVSNIDAQQGIVSTTSGKVIGFND